MKRGLLFCVGLAFNAQAAIAQDILNQASYTPDVTSRLNLCHLSHPI